MLFCARKGDENHRIWYKIIETVWILCEYCVMEKCSVSCTYGFAPCSRRSWVAWLLFNSELTCRGVHPVGCGWYSTSSTISSALNLSLKLLISSTISHIFVASGFLIFELNWKQFGLVSGLCQKYSVFQDQFCQMRQSTASGWWPWKAWAGRRCRSPSSPRLASKSVRADV